MTKQEECRAAKPAFAQLHPAQPQALSDLSRIRCSHLLAILWGRAFQAPQQAIEDVAPGDSCPLVTSLFSTWPSHSGPLEAVFAEDRPCRSLVNLALHPGYQHPQGPHLSPCTEELEPCCGWIWEQPPTVVGTDITGLAFRNSGWALISPHTFTLLAV